MKHRQKRGSWCIIGLLPVWLLAACTTGPTFTPLPAPTVAGGSDPGPENVVITFACLSHLYGEYAELAGRFHEQNPGIVVQIISADGATEAAAGSELVRLARTADTFLSFVPWQHRLRQQHSALLELGPLIQQDRSFDLGDFYPAMLDRLQLADALWGLPANGYVGILYYDRAAFDAAKLSYPQPGWTWDDFLERAEQLTVRDGEEVSRYGFIDLVGTPLLTSLVLQQAGTLWQDQIPPLPRLQDPKVAAAMAWYIDLVERHRVMPNPAENDRERLRAMQAAMWTATSGDYEAYQLDPDVQVGMAPLPAWGEAMHPLWLSGYFISAGTRHPQASWRWIQFLSRQSVEHYNLIPARRSLTPASTYWQNLDEGSRGALEYALAHAATPSDEVAEGLGVALQAALQDGRAITEALSLGQEKAMDLVAETFASQPISIAVDTPQPTPEPAQTVITFVPQGDWQRTEYEKLVPQFGASHPDIDVLIGSPPSWERAKTWDGVLEELKESDCFAFQTGHELISGLIDKGIILDLTPLVGADSGFALGDFPPSILAPVTVEDRLWALPYGGRPLMFFYHRDLFASAGIGTPTAEWTVDEFASAATALGGPAQEDEGERVYGFQALESDYVQAYHSFLRRWYGPVWVETADGRARPALDSPAMLEALAHFRTLVQETMVPLPVDLEGTVTMVMGGHAGDVDTGRVAMWVGYWWLYDMAPPLDFEVGIGPWPQADNSLFVSGYYVSAESQSPQACWRWLRFLSDSQAGQSDALPVRWSSLQDPRLKEQMGEEAFGAYRATLEAEPAPVDEPLPPWAHEIPRTWLAGILHEVLEGADPAVALSARQIQVRDWVDCLEQAGENEEQQWVCYHEAGLLEP